MQFKRLTSMCDLFFLNVIVILFKVFGTAPFRVSINSNPHYGKRISLKISQSVSGTVYNMLLSLGLMVMIVYNMYSMDSIVEFKEEGGNPMIFILTSVYLILTQLSVAIILIIFALNQQKLVISINKLLHTNRLLKKTLGDTYHFEIRRYLTILFTLYYSLYCSTTIFLNAYMVYDRIIVNILHFVIANVMLQYVISFTYIQKIYHSINSHLLLFAKCQLDPIDASDVLSNPRCTNINAARNKIIFCRKMQSALGEISYEFLEFYSWSILFAICTSCGNLIYTTYKLVITIIFEKREFDVDSFYWFLRTLNIIFHLVIVTGSINDLFNEIKRTSDIIYQLMSVYPEKSKVMFELEQFSMELLHRKQIEFTACGLFTLDRSLLASGSRIMFTYMILLIQAHFDRGFFRINNFDNSTTLNETISTSIPTFNETTSMTIYNTITTTKTTLMPIFNETILMSTTNETTSLLETWFEN